MYLYSLVLLCPANTQTQFTPALQISYSHANHIPFLGTGGGHGYSTTLGALRNGIELDLSLFNSNSIETAANNMTVGGSVTFCDVFPAL